MRLLLGILIFQTVFLLNINTTHGLTNSGNVTDDIYYSDLEIIYRNKQVHPPGRRFKRVLIGPKSLIQRPSYIIGNLKNKSDQKIYLSAVLNFNDLFGRTTATAKINKTISAYGEASFKSTIKLPDDNGFSDYKLEWDIYTNIQNTPRKKTKKKSAENNSPSSFIRELSNGVQITGANSITTDTFQLKNGETIFTAESIGKNFTAFLINKDTKKRVHLFQQAYQDKRKEKIKIENDGIYYLQIDAQNSWRIVVEFSPEVNTDDSTVEDDEAVNGRYIIHLKNGRKIVAKQLIKDSKRITFFSNGIKISINRNKVLKIERSD